jgi:hypothetical protein
VQKKERLNERLKDGAGGQNQTRQPKRHMIRRQDRQEYKNGTEKEPDDGTTHGVDFSWGQLFGLSHAIPSSVKPCAKGDVGPEGGVSDMHAAAGRSFGPSAVGLRNVLWHMSNSLGNVNIYSYSMQCDGTRMEKIEGRLCRVLKFPR